jgi:hypothetical protein
MATRIRYNAARESRSPIATINVFEAPRTEGEQATQIGRNATQRKCARARLREKGKATNRKRWIADCEIAY